MKKRTARKVVALLLTVLMSFSAFALTVNAGNTISALLIHTAAPFDTTPGNGDYAYMTYYFDTDGADPDSFNNLSPSDILNFNEFMWDHMIVADMDSRNWDSDIQAFVHTNFISDPDISPIVALDRDKLGVLVLATPYYAEDTTQDIYYEVITNRSADSILLDDSDGDPAYETGGTTGWIKLTLTAYDPSDYVLVPVTSENLDSVIQKCAILFADEPEMENIIPAINGYSDDCCYIYDFSDSEYDIFYYNGTEYVLDYISEDELFEYMHSVSFFVVQPVIEKYVLAQLTLENCQEEIAKCVDYTMYPASSLLPLMDEFDFGRKYIIDSGWGYFFVIDLVSEYDFEEIYVSADDIVADLEEGAEIYVIQAAPTYRINAADGIQNGTVTFDKTSAAAGETVTVTATPDPGCELVSITVMNAEDYTVKYEFTDGTFVMPAAEVVVRAIFAQTEVPPQEPDEPDEPVVLSTFKCPLCDKDFGSITLNSMFLALHSVFHILYAILDAFGFVG